MTLTPRDPPDLRTDLELAGLSLDVPSIGARWTVPTAIAIHDDHLVWSGAPRRHHVDPPSDFLTRFATLALVSNDQLGVAVLAFARQWGVLRLCAHGLPATYRPLRFAVGNDQPPGVCQPQRSADGSFAEPLERWRIFAKQAYALLRAAAGLELKQPVTEDEWIALAELFPVWMRPVDREQPLWRLRKLTDSEMAATRGEIGDIRLRLPDKANVAFAVRRWLDLADVRPVFTLDGGPAFGFGGQTLFAGLALRLQSTLSSRSPLTKRCGYCGRLYEPKARERQTTACCGSEECNRQRANENSRNKRVGRAKPRGPYGSRND